ncbi:MAG TPA: hypothetical protein VII32_05920 [Thermoanaerobaculia bacterium]
MRPAARRLALAATAFGGVLAGINVDRMIVQFPALRTLGPETWGNYSRNADLAATGMTLYPLVGIGHAALSVATAIAASRDRRSRTAAITAAGLALGGMALTFKAAPFMLSVRKIGNDTVVLERARRGFNYWSRIRAACQIGAFAANVWTLR